MFGQDFLHAGALVWARHEWRCAGAAPRLGRVFAGNFLCSTGPNSQGDSKRTTRGHYDVPMRGIVMLDNEVIIDKGNVTDPKMRSNESPWRELRCRERKK